MNYFAYNERKASQNQSYPVFLPQDLVEAPDMMVSEAEATPDSMRQYLKAEERQALQLTADAWANAK